MPRNATIQKIYKMHEKECNIVYSQFKGGSWTITARLHEELVRDGYTHVEIITEKKIYTIGINEILSSGRLWYPKHHITGTPVKKLVFPVYSTNVVNIHDDCTSQLALI